MPLNPFPTVDSAAFYLAALIDGEGNVQNGKTKTVTITNTSPSIIAACMRALDRLDIPCRVYEGTVKESRKSVWRVHVSTYEGMQKVLDQVPIQDEGKRERLRAIMGGPRRSWLESERPVEEVRRLYWEEGLSQRAIAERLNCSKGRIEKLMDSAEIPRRDKRSAALSH